MLSSSSCTATDTGTLSRFFTSRPPSRVRMAISLSSRYTILLVYSMMGEASEPIMNSLSPIPIAKGELFLAATMVSGRSESITAMA